MRLIQELQVVIFNTLEQLRSLQEEWSELFSTLSHTTPYQSWEWCFTWCEIFLDQYERLEFLFVYDVLGLVMVLPFALLKNGDGKMRAVLAGHKVSDETDVLIKPGYEEYLEEVLLHWFKESKVSTLEVLSVPDWSPLTPIFRKWKSTKSVRFIMDPFWGNQSINRMLLPPTWEDYLSTQSSKNHRKIVRRALNGVEEAHLTWNYTEHQSEDEVSTLVDLHNVSRELRDLESSIWADPQNRKFLEKAFARMFASGQANLFTLTDHDHLVGFYLLLRDQHWYYAHMFGYDVQYLSIGPGKALMAYASRYAIEHGYSGLDMAPGPEDYKKDWCNSSTPVTSGEFLILGPIKGLTLFLLEKARKKVCLRSRLRKLVSWNHHSESPLIPKEKQRLS